MAMGWGKIDRSKEWVDLPDGIVRVEYLRSNGDSASTYGLGPYILSQYNIVAGNIFEIEVSFPSVLSDRTRVLGRNAGSWECFINFNGSGYFGGGKFTSSSFVSGSKYKIRFDLTSGAMSLTVNDTVIKTGTGTQPDRKNFPLFVVASDAQNILSNNVPIFIYRFKTWHNNELVEDFIPVRIGNEGAMYDRVSGQLFRNQGTGSFIYGPDTIVSKPVISLHKKYFWENPYVTDGLVAMYDGIGNIGWKKHNASSNEWVDLVGNNNLSLDERYVAWNDDGLTISDCPVEDSLSFAAQASGDFSGEVRTIEICGFFPYDLQRGGSYLHTGYKGRGIGGFGGGWITSAVDRTFASNCKFFSGLLGNYAPYDGSWSIVYNSDIDNTDVDAYKGGTIFTGSTTPYGPPTYASFTNITIRSSYEIKVRSLRIYNRALTADEIAVNYAVDK